MGAQAGGRGDAISALRATCLAGCRSLGESDADVLDRTHAVVGRRAGRGRRCLVPGAPVLAERSPERLRAPDHELPGSIRARLHELAVRTLDHGGACVYVIWRGCG